MQSKLNPQTSAYTKSASVDRHSAAKSRSQYRPKRGEASIGSENPDRTVLYESAAAGILGLVLARSLDAVVNLDPASRIAAAILSLQVQAPRQEQASAAIVQASCLKANPGNYALKTSGWRLYQSTESFFCRFGYRRLPGLECA